MEKDKKAKTKKQRGQILFFSGYADLFVTPYFLTTKTNINRYSSLR
jgi:hypothetical protein